MEKKAPEDDSIKQSKSYFFWSYFKIKPRWHVDIMNSELAIKLYLKSQVFVIINSEQILNPKKLLIIYFSTRTWVSIFGCCLLEKLCRKFCLFEFLTTTEK